MEDIKLAFEQRRCWGIAASVDVEDCNPSTIRSEKKIKTYVKELIKLIDMKPFGECQVIHFGDHARVAGYSMVQLIETSLISGHFANQTNTAYIDIFSCKYYDPAKVAQFTTVFFSGKNPVLKVNLRK